MVLYCGVFDCRNNSHCNSASEFDKTFEESFREGFFQVISIITCTGFTSTDYMIWPGAASSSNLPFDVFRSKYWFNRWGIRMARHLIVLKNIKNIFVKLNHPKSISFIKLNGKSVSENTNISILSFVVFIPVYFCAWNNNYRDNRGWSGYRIKFSSHMYAGIGPGLGSGRPNVQFCQSTWNKTGKFWVLWWL